MAGSAAVRVFSAALASLSGAAVMTMSLRVDVGAPLLQRRVVVEKMVGVFNLILTLGPPLKL